mmetsp:Transcript_20618/g.23821  ORF Transcript_20618/g.23821 Transcript_20618/m.23821 type:complete len:383 (-) Transcript_20618:97-1245(-)|eukprot:CAMPEP_0176449706 /NCGR_PEP_ID=MMETSP0127-20121128/26650_1 /TAXON_ID=938130 /ORGANISM="Platyophrya macrostoma, Strain WH" /LENGTH=382 /DNA_ID=CAMNT_0017837121 /DNA_START=35 /DNA_END=1183 /DNA_ORIENTATION=-
MNQEQTQTTTQAGTQQNQADDATTNDTKDTKVYDFNELLNSIADKEAPSLELPKNFEDEKSRKYKKRKNKNDKDIDAVLASSSSENEKLAQIFELFQKALTDTKTVNSEYYTAKRAYLNAKTERETVQTDNTKIFNINNNLNNLYEDLKRQNQKLIAEHNELQDKEKLLRKQLGERFQAEVTEITQKYEETSKEQFQKSNENQILNEKMKEIDQIITKREETLNEHLTKKEQERDAHFGKTMEQFQIIENEAGKKAEYQVELDKALELEKEATEKMNGYIQKSDGFQAMMGRANDFFTQIKKEIGVLNNKVKKLDDENVQLQKNCERKDVRILELIADCGDLKTKLEKATAQTETLKNLEKNLESQIATKRQELGEITNKQE